MSMQGLFYRGPKKIELGEAPAPKVQGDRDVQIKVEYCGICGTDIGIYWGHHPANENIIMGHEYCGTVTDCGDGVTNVKPGDKVVVDPNIACGVCYFCRNDMQSQCEYMATGTTLGIFRNGGLARLNVAPESALYKIPDDMPFRSAALVEPLTCVLNGVKSANPQPEHTVLVLGAGPIGALFADLLARRAASVIVSELSPARREHVKKFTPFVFDPGQENIFEKVREITHGRMADIAIDCTGVLMADALKCVKKRGVVQLFGMNSHEKATIEPFWITRNEITIQGTYIAHDTFDPAIDILYRGGLDINHFITKETPLKDACEAFRALGLDFEQGEKTNGEAVKILIQPTD